MGKFDHQLPPAEALAAAKFLQRAYLYAPKMDVDFWEFAVPLRHLVELGVQESDLRWLVLMGYAEHACEITTFRDVERRFRRSANNSFVPQTCFVLTEAGVEFLRARRPTAEFAPPSFVIPFPTPAATSDASVVPHWDSDLRVLRVGGQIVKRFRQPAVNQVTVLSAFEDASWRPRIDNPLLPQDEQDPKHQLNRTIERLNKDQDNPLIRFYGDGTGQGVCWEPLGVTALKLRSAA